MKKDNVKHLIGTCVIMALTFVLCFFQLLYTFDKVLADRLFQQPSATNPAIKIIKIDEKSLKEIGQYMTWNRDIPARLVELLSADPEAKPAVIAFDVLYVNEMDEAGDTHFAEACREAGNVITATNLVYNKKALQDHNGDYYVDELNLVMVEESYPALRETTDDAFANTTQDKDGYIRQALAYAETENGIMYSLSYQTYMRYMEYLGEEPQMPKLYENNKFDFTFSGKSGAYETVSICDVLDGTIDPRVFKDCIVLVGAYAPGMQDSFNVAVQRGAQMYGVEIHANIVEALLEGKTAVPVSPLLTAVLMALAAGLICHINKKMKILYSVLFLTAVSAAEIMLGKFLFVHGYTMQILVFPVIMIDIFIGSVVGKYVGEQRKRRDVVRAFKKYVAPQVVDEVSKSGEFKLFLGGEKRDIAVMFVDIRGFTPMSENLQPEQVVEILNEYLSLTTNSIFKNGGTLDKFIGDATMAVFNAPFDLDDYVFRAICTARDIIEGADELNKRIMERFGRTISFGIGINCGNAVVGNIGCDFRMDYTAIGDTVNTAARLESNAKRGQILVSEDVYERVKERVEVTSIGVIPLKGKSNGISVYSIDKVLG